MIVGDNMSFFIQYDTFLVTDGGFMLGPFNFWINNKAYPGERCNVTISSAIPILQGSLERLMEFKFSNKELKLEDIDFLEEKINEKNLMYFYVGELGDYGFGMMVNVVDDQITVYYKTEDFNYKSIKMDLSYFIGIISSLKC
ncbi:MAG: Imm42 family immunity protein [Neisseria sp.]|nr:Imm42 family immunity protein [Neisseria sp.]